MQFPYYFSFAGHRVHPHLLMELIGYTGGFQIYLWLRRKKGKLGALPLEQNMWILVGCVFGALVGSKVLAWAESWRDYWAHRNDLVAWLGGKTIVGGLLGGWIGVEIAKWKLRLKKSTGDLFVFPLIFGMAVGRVGCFLTGLPDHTYGTATSLPWGVDFGDGIRRHPTQIYEIGFLVVWGLMLWIGMKVPVRGMGFQPMLVDTETRVENPCHGEGTLFRVFMLGYLAMRFLIEFIKPSWKPYAGLSAIQLACVGGMMVCVRGLANLRRRENVGSIYEHA